MEEKIKLKQSWGANGLPPCVHHTLPALISFLQQHDPSRSTSLLDVNNPRGDPTTINRDMIQKLNKCCAYDAPYVSCVRKNTSVSTSFQEQQISKHLLQLSHTPEFAHYPAFKKLHAEQKYSRQMVILSSTFLVPFSFFSSFIFNEMHYLTY